MDLWSWHYFDGVKISTHLLLVISSFLNRKRHKWSNLPLLWAHLSLFGILIWPWSIWSLTLTNGTFDQSQTVNWFQRYEFLCSEFLSNELFSSHRQTEGDECEPTMHEHWRAQKLVLTLLLWYRSLEHVFVSYNVDTLSVPSSIYERGPNFHLILMPP